MTQVVREPDELRRIAIRAAGQLDGAPADAVLDWAAAEFGERFAVATSMQDAVLTHLASRSLPGVDVLFLDTGYHFEETLQTRDAVASTYDVTLRTLEPSQSVAQQDATYGANLFERDPDLCCTLRKTHPLDEALDGYEAWATGVRRSEAITRRDTPVVSFDERRERIKVAPIVAWSDADVEAYIAEHAIVTNPLLTQGYPSIGCATCTRRVAPGEDARAGRWAGRDKVECGINT
ncbi:phosphoadenylyl-sulfate reductase [Dermacoccus nishinomiyaensis]|uniref:phosphoadenylyl-sulfate reductase n=1 Tax=Dermacoccus TaxID=57495 RepID=UPI0001E646CD|nr:MULTISPECIES: phosphoadenylyl-sulfate reductase [Dermacoccus]EFP58398.1 phosophoadenylyl-sulfate reductase [Dermacoccus sp. Ellin185]MBO1757617.1 phosphoadenylyl-sulfate reductase [Dermacoccus sp. NHGro5]MCT1603231.1 phosphoadenylyl-sulfate reductase [Dermacoccus nishinomiyaensis]QQY23986.1 phosphoadenylyl-sulfate reductase [Dermacoccus nishinomiyaensis]TCJ92045.1 phosphoadenylylsulfate reductase (thioredoxin) [Dermacoccus sp. SAI-028]